MIRWLIGILIVANLVIFLWGQLIVKPGGVNEKELLPEFGSIKLVREFEAESESIADTTQSVAQEASGLQGEKQSAGLSMETGGDNAVAEVTEEEPVAIPEAEAAEPVKMVEVTAETEPESGPVAVAPAPEADPVLVCGRIGPFSEEKAAQANRDALVAKGLSADIDRATEQVQKGYWVLIPALPSRAEGQEEVAKLREAGETDIWLFNKGPLKNAISLGLYAGEKNANRRSKQVNKLGFTSEVQPKISESTRYWLEFRGEQEKMGELDSIKLPESAAVEKKACK